MKFLSKLAEQYKALELEKPQWVLEYDSATANPMLGATAQVAANVGRQVGPTAIGTLTNIGAKSVIDSLNALVGNTPKVQEMKAKLNQATGEAEKKAADATNSVIDKIKQTITQLDKIAKTPSTSPTTSSTPTAGI